MQVIYLVREVWRGVSARADWHVLPGGDMGTKRSLADLALTRSALGHLNLPTHRSGCMLWHWSNSEANRMK